MFFSEKIRNSSFLNTVRGSFMAKALNMRLRKCNYPFDWQLIRIGLKFNDIHHDDISMNKRENVSMKPERAFYTNFRIDNTLLMQ